MEAKTCPHCNNQIPPEFAVMPVCTMCGGDLNAQPSSQQWASLDINEQKTYNCPVCQTQIDSVLVTECPNCKSSIQLASQTAETISEPISMAEPISKIDQSVDDLLPEEVVSSVPTPSEPSRPEKEGFFSKLLRMLGLKK